MNPPDRPSAPGPGTELLDDPAPARGAGRADDTAGHDTGAGIPAGAPPHDGAAPVPGPPRPDPDDPGREVGPGAAPAGEGGVHPRVWQRRVAVVRDQGRRRLRWVVAAVVALAGVCVAVVVLHTPLAAVRTTTVVGAPFSQDAAVLAAAGLADHPPLIDVDPRATAARVEALPWVAHAVVVRHWPDAVTVRVTPRQALGAVPRPGGGVAVVDAAGHVMAWQPAVPGDLLISGPVPPGRPGTVLGAGDRPALEAAAALPAPVAARTRQVSVNRAGVVAMDLGDGVSAVLGPVAQLSEKMTDLVSVLDGAHPTGPAVIDLTVPGEPAIGLPPRAR